MQQTKTDAGGPLARTFFALGTMNNIKIFDSYKEDAVVKAIERVQQIDDQFSAFKLESDISK
ncbi:MAG: hypothetical protein WCN92_06795, partial [Eubacteriales bacterium]